MSRKNRPNKPAILGPAAAPAPPPVLHGNCFHTFIAEARSLGNEVTARRAFDAEVGEYIAAKGLTDDFNAWREARRAPKPA